MREVWAATDRALHNKRDCIPENDSATATITFDKGNISDDDKEAAISASSLTDLNVGAAYSISQLDETIQVIPPTLPTTGGGGNIPSRDNDLIWFLLPGLTLLTGATIGIRFTSKKYK